MTSTGGVPAEKCITQALQHFAASAPVVEYSAPDPTVFAAQVPDVEHLTPAAADCAAPATGVECIGPVLEMSAAPAPVVERVRQLQWVFWVFCATVEFHPQKCSCSFLNARGTDTSASF